MNQDKNVDVAIIGAGTAGLSAFKEASKYTKNIIIIDHGPLGTTCARVGCMPSKVLIQVADSFYQKKYFSRQGIKGASHLNVDIPYMMNYLRELRDYFTSGVIKYTKSLGDKFIKGTAKFIEPTVIEVDKKKISAKSVIIATGSHSIIPNDWKTFSSRILTSENIFEQKDFSKNIAVIGAGVIGLELGQALSRLERNITMFHANDFVGGLSDPIVNECAIKIFKEEFPLHICGRAQAEANQDKIIVKSDNKSKEVQQIVAALGREPNIKALNLENLGIKFNDSGFPIYDNTTMQIKGNLPLFFAGDVNKSRPLLHEAADEGRIAGFNAIRQEKKCFQRRVPLMIIFTDPNIAVVGQSFSSLKNKTIVIGEAFFEDQGRSRIMQINKGVLRIYGEKETGKLLGAEMIAPFGEHLAHMLAWAIQKKMTVFDVLEMPYYHPTVQEGMRTALRSLAKQTKAKQPDFELAICDSEAMPELS